MHVLLFNSDLHTLMWSTPSLTLTSWGGGGSEVRGQVITL